MFTIKSCDIYSPDVLLLLEELNASLLSITGNSGAGSFSLADMSNVNNSRNVFLIGYLDEQPLCCGAIREFDSETAEMKRIYARMNSVGAAHKMVQALEETAAQYGFQKVILETRIINQHAVQFYLDCGYEVCNNYGKYENRTDAVCFSKKLTLS